MIAIFHLQHPEFDGDRRHQRQDRSFHRLRHPWRVFPAGAGRRFTHRVNGATAGLAWLFSTLYGATDETHQLFVPGRSALLLDLLADAIGGAAVVLVIWGAAAWITRMAKKARGIIRVVFQQTMTRIALVVSEYHALHTSGLEAGARGALAEAGIADDGSSRSRCLASMSWRRRRSASPRTAGSAQSSAWAVSSAARRALRLHRAGGGAGILHAAQRTDVPIAFGVLTTNTADEAMARAGDGPQNKGVEAARAAVAMARLYARLGPVRTGHVSPAGRP